MVSLLQEKSVNRFTFLGSYIFDPKLPNQAKIVITDKGLQPPDSYVADERRRRRRGCISARVCISAF
jgi:hypothetical protein